MKKIIISLLIVFIVPFSMFSQTDNNDDSSDFNKWQMRFRLVSVIPDANDDLDGAEVTLSTAVVPELDFTYFFTENLAAELILATTKHNVGVDVDGSEVADLGHVWLLPPTLNLQYHFTGGTVKPYLGAGINYTIFYGIDEGEVVDIDYDSSVGFSLQGGLDYDLNDKWFLNFDIKKLFLKTDVSVDVGEEEILPVDVDINPLIIGLGVGMRF